MPAVALRRPPSPPALPPGGEGVLSLVGRIGQAVSEFGSKALSAAAGGEGGAAPPARG